MDNAQPSGSGTSRKEDRKDDRKDDREKDLEDDPEAYCGIRFGDIPKIAGGRDTEHGDWPWQVSLRLDDIIINMNKHDLKLYTSHIL